MPRDLPPLLLLCHRIPFPPDKGDKIRSYHLLRYLSERYRVFLATFIDDPADDVHVVRVSELCEDTCILRLDARIARILSGVALLSRAPLSVAYYRSRAMLRWIRNVAHRENIAHVVVFSSAMAQYAFIPELTAARAIVDFVDVDSDKWDQYAHSKSIWTSWIYRLEARRLATYENRVAHLAHTSVFVSDAEAALFRSRLSDPSVNVAAITNGVDTEYFSPNASRPSPYPASERAVVFTGAMDYWANVDAVTWFANEVMPSLVREEPSAKFYVVGSKPTASVLRLAGPNTKVTGRVDDVRPYLEHARAVVAPMRIARGIQNKVLEGMAMAKAVVTTPKGFEGIDAQPGGELVLASTAKDFVDEIAKLIRTDASGIGRAARRRVIESYSWKSALSGFTNHLNA